MILRQKIKQVSVTSIQKKISVQPDFLKEYLTAAEIRYCRAKRHFAEPAAARMAAKYACLNLLRIPAKQQMRFMHKIEVKKMNSGLPYLKLTLALNKKIKKNQRLLLSLAHERELAVAWVALVEKNA